MVALRRGRQDLLAREVRRRRRADERRASRRAPTGPFDIDLGTNRSGATYAVYTRDDGDIYRLNVATGSEVKVAKLSSPTLAERDPTIMRGEIAFIRRDRGFDQLRIGNTSGASKGSRLIVKQRSIVHAELGTTHVAYVVTGPGPISDSGARYMRIRNLRTGADRQVYRAVSGGANYANTTRPTYVASPAGLHVGAHEPRLGHRQPARALHAARLEARLRAGLAVLSLDGLGRQRRSARSTSSALAATPGAATTAACTTARSQLTGPLEFDLRP